jgi:hypothetical protein
MTKAINITAATFTAQQAGEYLAAAAKAAIDGKAAIDLAKGKQAAAESVMIAGFSDDTVAMREWTFDIKGNDGAVHDHVACTGTDQFGNTDLPWCRNSEGKVSKTAQSAYKGGLQHVFFNLTSPVAAVWTMASRAIPVARAIRQEGMTAKLVDGALVLEGGDTERAKAMREAKSLAALRKAVEGATGTNRDAPQNGEGEGEGSEGVEPIQSRADILRAAFAALMEAESGDGPALNETEAALAKGIAKVAAAIAKAEAEAEKAEKAEAARKAARA